MTMTVRTSIFVGVVVLFATMAHAAPRDQARQHYQAGQAAYKRGDFEVAAKEFQQGYSLDPKPTFLLNAAQSFRQAGNRADALRYYEAYLQVYPESPLRSQVEDLVAELKREIADASRRQRAQETAASSDATAPPETSQVPAAAMVTSEAPASDTAPSDDQSRPFYKTWWFWTSVGAVVAAGVGVGVYMGTQKADYVETGGLGTIRW